MAKGNQEMERLRNLAFILMSVILIASCNDGDDSSSETGGNNNGSGGSNTPTEQPIEVEALPNGVIIGTQTVQLNSVQLEHIVEVDDDNATLFFSSSLPDEQIPRIGQIILKYSPTEELPYGFLGRVSSITNEGDRIVVDTNTPSLQEAFDKLVISYDMNNVQTQTRTDISIGNDTYIDEDNYLRFTRTLSIDKPNIRCELDLGLNIAVEKDIDKEKDKDDQRYRFGIKAGASIECSHESKGSYDNRNDFGKGVSFKVPYVSPAIMGAVQFSWITQAEGNLNFHGQISSSVSRTYYVEKQDSDFSVFEEEGPIDSKMNVDIDKELIFEGEAFEGLGIRIDLRLFGRKELSVGIGTDIGPRIATEIDLLVDTNNLYEQYKDTAIELHGVILPTVFAQAKLFNLEKEWSKRIGDGWVFWDATRYIFPSFSNMSAEYISDNEVKCIVKYGRNLLFESEVGVAQYQSANMVSISTPLPYYNSVDIKNPMSVIFPHTRGFNYWTYVKWGDDIIQCKPFPELPEEEEESMIDENLLIGLWRYVPYDDDDPEGYCEFFADGGGCVSDIDSDYHFYFSWYINGSTIVIYYYDEYDEEDVTETGKIISITDNELILSGDGNIVHFVRLR